MWAMSALLLRPEKSTNGSFFAAYTAISLGTVFGGWRIVKTMGTSITRIREMEGFAPIRRGGGAYGTGPCGYPVQQPSHRRPQFMGVRSVEHCKISPLDHRAKNPLGMDPYHSFVGIFAFMTYKTFSAFLPK